MKSYYYFKNKNENDGIKFFTQWFVPLLLVNRLCRKLNEMQFEFGVITQSLVLEGLSESRLTPLEKEEKFLFIGRQQIKHWLIDIKIIPANFLFYQQTRLFYSR